MSVRRIASAAVLLAVALTAGCHPAARPKANKIIEVVVTVPIVGQVTDSEDFTGRIESLETVDIRPRVSGYVDKAPAHEKEGQFVRKGELLFEIDPRTYKADLNLAEANLKQAEAELRLQIKNIERGRKLLASSSIGKEEYDQILASREKAAATVESMKATRDRAKLYEGFTHVVAPLDGRLGLRMADPGNLVNADQTILTTIVTEDPVYAYFDVDERTYLQLATATSTDSTSYFSKLAFPVMMRLANEEDFTQVGLINFLDNRLNANTGTVRMRGQFDNPQGHLKSGLFVRIRLPIGIPYKTRLIPDEAVQSDQGRKFVYVVKTVHEEDKDGESKEKHVVEYRSVVLGQAIQKLRAIRDAKRDENGKIVEGLDAGERVIVKGMQRVRPGVEVRFEMQEPPKPPRSSLTELLTSKRAVTE